MYGLPEDLDLSFFIGKRLDTITFAEFVMHFNFEGNVSVTLESSFQHQRRLDVEKHWFGVQQSVPVAHSGVMQLVGRSVLSATGDKEGTLTLTFDDGQVLCLFEERKPYESYQITEGENLYVV